MAARLLYRILALAGLLSALSACVYPFEIDLADADTRLAIDGDIHIGGITRITLSRAIPLAGDPPAAEPMQFEAYIEGEDGTRVAGQPGEDNTLTFDTSGLPDTQRYRACFKDLSDGNEYETDWLVVHPAPVIDALTYTTDSESGLLNVALSMHASGEHRFRWYYDETWEYHADLWARYYYDPDKAKATGSYKPLNGIIPYPDGFNTYYCWKQYTSPSIRIFSTSDQSEDRFVDLEFHQVPRTDQRLQILYKLTVHLDAMDEEAYKYWHNIEQNSQNQGSIFSPMPSQMSGNIRCTTDPSIQVLGYMGAAREASAELYYDDSVGHFYQPEHKTIEVTDADPIDFERLHGLGYALYDVSFGSEADPPSYQWISRSCVDCRTQGGTKNKPAGWPNNHN